MYFVFGWHETYVRCPAERSNNGHMRDFCSRNCEYSCNLFLAQPGRPLSLREDVMHVKMLRFSLRYALLS